MTLYDRGRILRIAAHLHGVVSILAETAPAFARPTAVTILNAIDARIARDLNAVTAAMFPPKTPRATPHASTLN